MRKNLEKSQDMILFKIIKKKLKKFKEFYEISKGDQRTFMLIKSKYNQ